jgi:hypothetical protein
VIDAALVELTDIRRRWDELDAGAVAQSATDRAEVASALLKVHQAERAADDAERSRAETAAAALKDQQRRVAAEQGAEAAVAEAEHARKTAWQQTADHERARGQAEARAILAEQGQRDSLDQLDITRRELRDLTALQQDTARKLNDALSAADRADGARALAEARIAAADERARLAHEGARLAELGTQRAYEETAAARESEAAARAHAAEAAQALAALQSAHAVVVERLSSQDKHIADLRAQLNAAGDRERLLISARPEPPAAEQTD